MKYAYGVASALVIACGGPQPQSQPPSVPSAGVATRTRIERIERIERGMLPQVQVKGEDLRFTLEERMRENKIPAVSIAVIDNYAVHWAKAYGVSDTETGMRVDEETTFLAGSISKSVNALGVLLAAADGTLALDKPINDQLESWKLPDNELTRASPVTLRRLLSHTGGTTVHGFPGYVAGRPLPTVQQILDGQPPANNEAVRVDLAPGTKFRYSSGGTTISMLALVERSKKPYPQVLAERVLAPLGMVHSSFDQVLSPERLKHAAVGHDGGGAPIDGKRNQYPEMAAAGLWTTPTDLAKCFIAIALARAGNPSPVPHEVAMQMTTSAIVIEDAPPGTAVGLGVFLNQRNGDKVFGHGGSDEGFQAYAVMSLDGGHGVIVMTNSNNGSKLFEEIERSVWAEYGWPGADTAITRVVVEPSQRARFVGEYSGGNAPIKLVDTAGRLELRSPFEKAVEVVPIAQDAAVVRSTGDTLRLAAGNALESTSPRGSKQALARRLTEHHLFAIEAGRFDDAVASWRAQLDPANAGKEEEDANALGYKLLANEPAMAIEVFRLIATVFPDSSNAHDSLGEVYAHTGDKVRAIKHYELALRTLDADPRLSAGIKKRNRAHAEAQLAELRKP